MTTRRGELADFLRTRRERIAPEDVGLPAGGRRRTPGLRREEVALLAGVGVTWYTWLEQGRDINASVQVLEAIARTLRMDNQERWHLFELAGVTIVPPAATECQLLGGIGQEILDQLDPLPAVVLSPRSDILGYNRAYNRMGGDLDSMEPGELNQIWLFFTHPYWQDLCRSADRERAAAYMVGSMRTAATQHLEDVTWDRFIRRLREASAEFDELWRRHDVADLATPAKNFKSPVGELRLQMTRMTIGTRGLTRMNVYSPRDEETRARLVELVAYDAEQKLRAVG
ncbi:MAG: helix-turn-helix transcriptional regulator [Nocardioides sp.]|uniref:helix-turn-helix transcriptional regulator n=1 Tax=Nocardioides sp. TaxID=35761 RepID=UPI0039E57170